MNTIFSTAIEWDNGRIYFFSGNKYIRYNIALDRSDTGYPNRISGAWPGLWGENIDAAVNWGNGIVYFFRGDEYCRYDIANDRVEDGYPVKIEGRWPGLWSKNIDAAINWGNGIVYFFRGDEYCRYNIANDRVEDGYPVKIEGRWPGLWSKNIDAAINWGNGIVYFFRGDEYSRYNIANDRVDDGYPVKIFPRWPGLFFESDQVSGHGLVIINNSPFPVPAKSEFDSSVKVIQPNDWEFYPFDGIAAPNQSEGKILKCPTGSTVVIDRDGNVNCFSLIGNPVWDPVDLQTRPDWAPLIQYANDIEAENIREANSQERDDIDRREQRERENREYLDRLDRYDRGERDPGEPPRRNDEMRDPF